MLRWGILGTGFISNTVIEPIALSDESQATVFAGRNPERVEQMRAAHDIARGIVGYQAVIDDPDIDALYIGTPNDQHHQLAIWHPHAGDREEIVISDEHDAFYHQIKMVEDCISAGRSQARRPSPRLADSLEIMSMLTEWEALCLASAAGAGQS